MINYSVGLRPNPQEPDAPKKAYAYVQARETMDINRFAEHISAHGSVYGRADIAAVLTMAVDCMRENLLNGNLIKLGDLGTFSISLQSAPADSVADFKADANITGVSAKWAPGERFVNMLNDAVFQAVPARSVMRKLMKSLKTGEKMFNLFDDEEDKPDGEGENPDNTDNPDNTGTGGSGNTGEGGGTVGDGDEFV